MGRRSVTADVGRLQNNDRSPQTVGKNVVGRSLQTDSHSARHRRTRIEAQEAASISAVFSFSSWPHWQGCQWEIVCVLEHTWIWKCVAASFSWGHLRKQPAITDRWPFLSIPIYPDLLRYLVWLCPTICRCRHSHTCGLGYRSRSTRDVHRWNCARRLRSVFEPQ